MVNSSIGVVTLESNVHEIYISMRMSFHFIVCLSAKSNLRLTMPTRLLPEMHLQRLQTI